MKLNRGALKLCGVYTVYFVLLVGLGHFGDPKARIILNGLAVAPAALPFFGWGWMDPSGGLLDKQRALLFSILPCNFLFDGLGTQRNWTTAEACVCPEVSDPNW
jgi:hypothetical protein